MVAKTHAPMPVSGYQLVMATPRCILFEPLSNCGLIKMDKNPFTELLDRGQPGCCDTLWRDSGAPGGIGVWGAKGLPILEAIIDRGSVATLPMVAFWLRDREHALAIEAQVARSTH
jgi:hypothetical protein